MGCENINRSVFCKGLQKMKKNQTLFFIIYKITMLMFIQAIQELQGAFEIDESNNDFFVRVRQSLVLAPFPAIIEILINVFTHLEQSITIRDCQKLPHSNNYFRRQPIF